jgi:hypothetical protein
MGIDICTCAKIVFDIGIRLIIICFTVVGEICKRQHILDGCALTIEIHDEELETIPDTFNPKPALLLVVFCF